MGLYTISYGALQPQTMIMTASGNHAPFKVREWEAISWSTCGWSEILSLSERNYWRASLIIGLSFSCSHQLHFLRRHFSVPFFPRNSAFYKVLKIFTGCSPGHWDGMPDGMCNVFLGFVGLQASSSVYIDIIFCCSFLICCGFLSQLATWSHKYGLGGHMNWHTK